MKLFPCLFVLIASVLLSCAVAGEQFHPAVEDFFNSSDPFIQQKVLPNVEKHRKTDACLRFYLPAGKRADTLEVSVALRRHRFHFGCAPREELAKEGPYREAWRGIWEYGVPENAQKWYRIEPEEGKRDYRTSDALVNYLKSNDYTIEYHFLTGYHPKWLAEKTDQEKTRLQKSHMLETVERYCDRVDYFQVYNEFWRLPVKKAHAFVDSKSVFELLIRKYPKVKFGVSDCWRLNERLPTPEEMRERFPGIDYIAVHAHAPRRLWVEPEVIYQCFEPYRNSNIKLHISEFGIREGIIERADSLSQEWSKSFEKKGLTDGETWNEELKAHYFVQTLMTCFSHPAVRAFCFWGMGPGDMFMDGNRMIDDDCSPLPLYEALHSLIQKKLRTRKTGNVDEDGRFCFRGYFGEYVLTLRTATGEQLTTRFQLKPENTDFAVVCDLERGCLRVTEELGPKRRDPDEE